MYRLWETSACLLLLGLVSASKIPTSSKVVQFPTNFCPETGYYYTKGPIPVLEGPCYLCRCQRGNSTASCSETMRSLCYNDHLGDGLVLDTPGRTRVRRGLLDMSDNFISGATNFFLGNQSEQCKPGEGSFSKGCPPADWCIGCTVCDCDANGRWNCHILSFCNKEERKQRLRGKKVILPKKMPAKRVNHQNKPKLKNKVTPKPKKVVKMSIPKSQYRQTPNQRDTRKQQNNKKPIVNGRKPNKNNKKPAKVNNNARKTDNKKRNQPKRRPGQSPQKKPTTKMPRRKRYMVKKPQHPYYLKTTLNQPTTPSAQKKDLRKTVKASTTEPLTQESHNVNSQIELYKSVLGRKIIKKVMPAVHNITGKQREKLQIPTRVQQSINSARDVLTNKNNNEQKSIHDSNLRKPKFKNYGQHYNLKKKRDTLYLDLSVMDWNDVDIIKDNSTVDMGLTRITKNVPKLDFGESNETKTTIYNDYSTKAEVSVSSTTDNYSAYSTANKDTSLNSSTKNLYYKYIVNKNSVNATLISELPPAKDETTNTSNVQNNSLTEINNNTTEKNTGQAKPFLSTTNDTDINDFKDEKWERIKTLRDNIIKINQVATFDKVAKSMIMQRTNIKRKLGAMNKHNLKKVINTNFKTASSNYFGTTLTPSNKRYNISSLHILLQNLMKELNRNSTAPIKLKDKFSLFKYLRNIYKQIFSRKQENYLKKHNITNEGMTLEILCNNIGACFLNKHNRIALRYKLHDLNAETEKIFKLIKIIKVLLFLIEMPVAYNNTTKKHHNDEMHKLDAILRGTFQENITLNERQAAQINHVQENIRQFIESVGRFATLLNEIIEVLYKNNKQYSCQRNLRLSQRKRKLNSFNKIKNLLLKYNILQNSFMKKMFQLLTDVEKNMTTENPQRKVSSPDMNNTQVIDGYSNHIIDNLRRLKKMAQALSSSRRKRQTMREDDAIEYLLTLMEYLLKQKHPLDTAPVNDGIDLLIEAIQNAPDIKLIKKKVLLDLPTTQTATRTTEVDLSYFKEDSISDSIRVSKEDNNSSKNLNNLVIEQVVDIEETTQDVYYKRFDDSNDTTIYNEPYPTTEYAVIGQNEKKKKAETGEKTGFDKFESTVDDTRRYEVFSSDVDDEPLMAVVVNNTEKPVPASVTRKDEETTFVPLQDYKYDDEPVSVNKTNLDWIEENYDKEIREYRQDNVSDTTISSAYTTQTPATAKPDQSVDNISSITVELDEEEKKTKSKIAADEVMYRKQIEFLNSLDYGTERSEFDDADIKDDEKYSGDGFPTYFVK